jgi:hypothetical protein
MKREHRHLSNFYPINNDFGCFIEYGYMNSPSFVGLVEFDFIDKIFRKIRTFELINCREKQIFVDESDSSKFTLIWKTNDAVHIQSFRLLNGTVNIENAAQYARNEFYIDHYFDGCVYGRFDVS